MLVYKELKKEYSKEVGKVTRPILKTRGINFIELKEIHRKAVEKINLENTNKIENFSEITARDFEKLYK